MVCDSVSWIVEVSKGYQSVHIQYVSAQARDYVVKLFDIDLIRLWRPFRPICRSKLSVLDWCFMKNIAGTLLPQILYMCISVHLLTK